MLAYAHVFTGPDVDLVVDLDAIAPLSDSPAEAMEAALAGLDVEVGSVGEFLVERCGLAPGELAALRRNVLSPS